MNAYASDKILAHLPVIQQLREGMQPAPVHVQMILSDLCNQDCGFCAYRMSGYTSNQLFGVQKPDGTVNNNPNRMIPFDKAMEIVDDCTSMGVKAIQFTGGGEPTVHPQFNTILKHAINQERDVALVTNGMRMTESIRDSLLNAKWCRISIDAGTASSYGHIRRVSPDVYGRVLGNIHDLVKLRDVHRSNLHVGVGYVVTAENWHEVLVAARTAKQIGVDSFRISALFQQTGASYFAAFRDQVELLCADSEQLNSEHFKVVNMFTNRIDDLHAGNPDYQRCGYQHLTTFIGGDQNVYRCCNTAYNLRGLIGSLKDRSFRDLWESQSKREDFVMFDARGCNRCMFNEKNRVINELIDFRAVHESFV